MFSLSFVFILLSIALHHFLCFNIDLFHKLQMLYIPPFYSKSSIAFHNSL